MRRGSIMAGFAAAVASGVVLGLNLHSVPRAAPMQASDPLAAVRLASSGRVEGLSETTEVGAGVEGVIATANVTQGTFVRRGALLASFACEDLKAELEVANAERQATQEVRARLLRGARQEERLIARQNVEAAAALRDQAASVYTRDEALHEEGLLPAAEFDKAANELRAANANLQAAREHENLTGAPPLREEVERADADLEAAVKRIGLARERIEKCNVRAPVDGTVVRVLARIGESYSVNMPRPLFRIADCRGRRIRAEVDERDVAKVFMDQRTLVLTEGASQNVFEGRVIQLAQTMGRKTVRSGDPAEKSDRDILEVLVAVPREAVALPLGLRVTVRFLAR